MLALVFVLAKTSMRSVLVIVLVVVKETKAKFKRSSQCFSYNYH